MILADYVHHWDPFIFEFGNGMGLRWYGTAYVVGFLAGYLLLRWFAKKGYSALSADQVGDYIAGVAFWGVLVGGRLGYIFFYKPGTILHDPLSIFKVWEGGMASHGGILGVILYSLYYSRRHHISLSGLGDNLVVAAPIGIFFGRIANFINGELYGTVTQAKIPWATKFPSELLEGTPEAQAMLAKAVPLCVGQVDPSLTTAEAIVNASIYSEPVRNILAGILPNRHPSQIYEALLEGLFLTVTLWILRTRVRPPEGVVTGAFFLLYAVVRIFGEAFRQPDAGIDAVMGLSRGQFLSLFMILIGLGFVIIGYRRNRPSPAP